MRSRVLCVEDDSTIQALVEASLSEYHVVKAMTLKDAESELSAGEFDAILLDIELPDGDGLKFLTKISRDSRFKRVPTLMLTGNSDIANKLMAFTFGADDFISKPFDPIELNARLTSKIRKIKISEDEKRVRKIGDLEIDFDRQMVLLVKNGKEGQLDLTSIEIKILALLSRRIEQVYSREQILESVWGNTKITDRTIDSHIAHLRGKLSDSRLSIDTVRNFGYRISLK